MNRIAVIALSAIMCIGMSTPAFAAEAQAGDAPGPEAMQADGQLIVCYGDDVSNKTIRSDISEVGEVEKIARIEDNKMVLVDLDVSESKAEAVLDGSKHVEFTQPNYEYRIKSADPYLAETAGVMYQYQLKAVNAEEAWDLLESGEHATTQVGVIDTGVDPKHEDLQENLITLNDKKEYMQFATGEEYIANDDADSEDGHGTHTSGIVGATYDNGKGGSGVASGHNNDLVSVLTTSASEDGWSLYTYDICKAIDYQVAHGSKVINMSFGGPSKDYMMEQVIDSYFDQGIVFVAASGNDSTNAYSSPADYDSVIAVNAAANGGAPAYYSDYGILKDISAPGSNVVSTVPGSRYGLMSGTSMASPVAAAVCGLVLDANPNLTPAQVKNIICATTKEQGAFDINLAYGNIDAKAAVEAAQNASTSVEPESITLKEQAIEGGNFTSVKAGETIPLTALVKPATCLQTVTWSTDTPDLLSVSQNGEVTGIAEGTGNVTATVGSVSVTCEIKVKPGVTCEAIEISGYPEEKIVEVGDEGDFTVKTEPANYTGDDFGFESSDQSVLFVDTTGAWCAKQAGTATVTVTQKSTGLTASVDIAVKDAVESLKFVKSKKYIRVGDSFTFLAQPQAEDLYKPEITYTTSNSRGTIDAQTGKFTAKKAGYCYVIATTYNDTFKQFKVQILKKTYSGKDYALKASKSKGSVKLTWKKQPLAVAYQIQKKTDKGAWKTLKTVTTLKLTDKKVKKGHKYQYRVKAKYKEGSKTGYYKWSTVRSVSFK